MKFEINILPIDVLDSKINELFDMLKSDKSRKCMEYWYGTHDNDVLTEWGLFHYMNNEILDLTQCKVTNTDWEDIVQKYIKPIKDAGCTEMTSIARLKKYYGILDEILDQIKIYQLIQNGVIKY